MKLQVPRSELATRLSVVSKVVSAKSAKAILQGILFSVSENTLTLQATDLEISLATRVRQGIMEGEGKFVVEGKVIDEIVKSMPGDEVVLQLEGSNLVVSSMRSRFTLPTMDPEEFPEISMDVAGEKMMLSTTLVETMLDRTVFSAAKDEVMKNLNGVYWEFEEGYFRMVTADGFRLALAEAENTTEFTGSFLLSLDSMKDFLNAIKTAMSDDLEVIYDGRRVGFVFDGTQMIVRVVEAEFPNYKQVLPKEVRTKVRVNRDSFISALKRVSIAAKLGSETVKLEVEEETLRISARSSDRGEAMEELEVQKDGEDIIIGFNPKFLLEACQHIDSEEIELNFRDPNSPLQINPADVEGYLYIVMPIRLV